MQRRASWCRQEIPSSRDPFFYHLLRCSMDSERQGELCRCVLKYHVIKVPTLDTSTAALSPSCCETTGVSFRFLLHLACCTYSFFFLFFPQVSCCHCETPHWGVLWEWVAGICWLLWKKKKFLCTCFYKASLFIDHLMENPTNFTHQHIISHREYERCYFRGSVGCASCKNR